MQSTSSIRSLISVTKLPAFSRRRQKLQPTQFPATAPSGSEHPAKRQSPAKTDRLRDKRFRKYDDGRHTVSHDARATSLSDCFIFFSGWTLRNDTSRWTCRAAI